MAQYFSNENSMPYVFGTSRAEVINALFRKVYQFMALGLILTSITAYFTASSKYMLSILYGSSAPMIVIAVCEIGLVLWLGAGINRISSGTALTLFAIYSILNGMLCSSVLLVYTQESVYSAFLSTAGMFGAMSLYGIYTKRDLTGFGSFLRMGLFGLLIAMVINIFIGSTIGEFYISIFGIIIFLGLTAWDTWKIRNLANEIDGNNESLTTKFAVIGALSLYLDFINIFLYMLRFFGRQRN